MIVFQGLKIGQAFKVEEIRYQELDPGNKHHVTNRLQTKPRLKAIPKGHIDMLSRVCFLSG